MTQLQFNFSLEQANVILKALDQMPYGQVSELVQQVHAQAKPQLEASENEQAITEEMQPIAESA